MPLKLIQQRFEEVLRTLSANLDGAVGAIAYRAAEVQFLRERVCGRTKAHALHLSMNDRMHLESIIHCSNPPRLHRFHSVRQLEIESQESICERFRDFRLC